MLCQVCVKSSLRLFGSCLDFGFHYVNKLHLGSSLRSPSVDCSLHPDTFFFTPDSLMNINNIYLSRSSSPLFKQHLFQIFFGNNVMCLCGTNYWFVWPEGNWPPD